MFATNVILSLFLSQLFIFIIKHCSVGLSRLRCFHEIGFRIWSSLCFIILALPGHVYYKLYSPQWGIFCLLLFIFNPSPNSQLMWERGGGGREKIFFVQVTTSWSVCDSIYDTAHLVAAPQLLLPSSASSSGRLPGIVVNKQEISSTCFVTLEGLL